ncbi:MAG: hypothetical protein M1833_002398 [Piccolia ochrophora]|nr:MAG: hypothetical protein M1833_002398 [Piccolia ochrophora]
MPPPPYALAAFAVPPPPPAAGLSAPRPDHGFPPGAIPFFGGYQPQPPAPPLAATRAPPPTPPGAGAALSAPGGVQMAGVDSGLCYLFPMKHTILHVIVGSTPPYEAQNTGFAFGVHVAPCFLTVKELIIQLGKALNLGGIIGVTECLEAGHGRWAKGISIAKDEDGAEQTLESLGWDNKRGVGGLPPVWVAVNKA